MNGLMFYEGWTNTWIYELGGLNFWIDKFIKRIEFMNELCIRRIELINGIMYLED